MPAKRAVEIGQPVVVQGYNSERTRLLVIPHWVFTDNVPKDTWEQFKAANWDADYLNNGLVLAGKSRREAERMTRDGNSWAGLEPMQVPSGEGQPIKDQRLATGLRNMRVETGRDVAV